jgi:hypothetical protein
MRKLVYLVFACLMLFSSCPRWLSASDGSSSNVKTVWDNPWTHTSYLANGRVNSTFYPFPKVVWNGSQWVDYILNSSDMSGGIGSTYIKVLPSYTIVYDPERTEERIRDECWMVERFNGSANRWVVDNPIANRVDYLVNSTGIFFNRKTTLQSGGSLQVRYGLRIGSSLKIAVSLNPSTTGEYRLVWRLSGVSGMKAESTIKTENTTIREIISDKNCSWIQFDGSNSCKTYVGWFDTYSFNETYRTWKTSFQSAEIGPDGQANLSYAILVFGNFSLATNEIVCLDLTIVTFNSEGAIGGEILRRGRFYPLDIPPDFTQVNTQSIRMDVGQAHYQIQPGNWVYDIYRSYVSFDTRSIPSLAYNISIKLKLVTAFHMIGTNFTVRVMGGTQGHYGIYGSSLNASDWGCGVREVGSWSTANYPGDNVSIELNVASDQLNKVNRTQFELKSSLEGYAAEGDEQDWVTFYSGNSNGNEPKLEVTYSLDYPPGGMSMGGIYWLYRKVSSDKVAIVLFGGWAEPT